MTFAQLLCFYVVLAYATAEPLYPPGVITQQSSDGCTLPGQGYDLVKQVCLKQIITNQYLLNNTFFAGSGGPIVFCPDIAECSTYSGSSGSTSVEIYSNISSWAQSYIYDSTLAKSAAQDGLNGTQCFNEQIQVASNVFDDGEHSMSGFSYYIQQGFEINLYNFPSLFKLNPSFTLSLSSLPKVYNKITQPEYIKWVKEWGMCYLLDGYYAGKVNMTVIFSNEVYQVLSIPEIRYAISCTIYQTSLKYGIGFGGLSMDGCDQKDSYKTFQQYSSAPINIYGGDPDAFLSGGLQNWLPTLYQAWALLTSYSQVAPIWNLVQDPVLAANIQQSATDYANGIFKL